MVDLISRPHISNFFRVVLQRAVVDPEERKGKNKMVRICFWTWKHILLFFVLFIFTLL